MSDGFMGDDAGDGGDDGLEYGTDTGDGTESGGDDFESVLAEHRAEMARGQGDGTEDGQAETQGDEDGEVSPDEALPPVKRGSSKESVVRRLQASEERVLQLENELKAAKAGSTQPRQGSSGDDVDDVIELLAQRMGIKPDDERLIAKLYEFGGELAAELAVREGRGDDERWRPRLEKRRANKAQAEIQRQIDELKAERQREQEALRIERDRSTGHQNMTAHLASIGAETEYPHLFAAEDDPVGTIFESIKALAESGHRIDDSNAEDTIAYVLKRLDDEHASRFRRLESLRSKRSGGKPAEAPIQPKRETRGAQKDGQATRNRREDRGGRTVTASGVGGRQAPVTKSDADKTPDEIFAEMLAERREMQRRQSNPNRR